VSGEWCGGRALGGVVFGKGGVGCGSFCGFGRGILRRRRGLLADFGVVFRADLDAVWGAGFEGGFGGRFGERVVGCGKAGRGAKWDGRSGPGRMGL